MACLHEVFTSCAGRPHASRRNLTGVNRLLVIEDDPTIAGAIADRFRSEGFTVVVEGDGIRGLELAKRDQPDLVILDVMLPGLDGIEVCRRLHLDRPVPVIMLTARDEETDLLVGLAVGADDYITKPFSMRELVARVRTVLRRADRPIGSGANADEKQRTSDPAITLASGTIRIDQQRRTVRALGDDVALTPTEFDLLVCLAVQNGAVRTREQLLQDVWGYRDGSGARTVDSHVRALRRKLGDGVIRTVHGVGYAMNDQEL
jgi:DNA-binding response OmpR family regulator